MYWLMVVVVAVVVFGVAAVAAGKGGAMAAAPPDRPGPGLPPGPLGAGDLERLRFAVGLRGYRMDEVDAVLDRLAAELTARDERIAELERRAPLGDGGGWPEQGLPETRLPEKRLPEHRWTEHGEG